MCMKKNILAVFLLTSAQGSCQQTYLYKIIAYNTGNGESIQQYPVGKLTHIMYSFLKLQNDTLTFHNGQQRQALQRLVQLKLVHPKLKIMVSVGGWGGCSPCSDFFKSAERLSTFAKTTVALFKQNNIDGLDYDWEYPAIEGYPGHKHDVTDKKNFTFLVIYV